MTTINENNAYHTEKFITLEPNISDEHLHYIFDKMHELNFEMPEYLKKKQRIHWLFRGYISGRYTKEKIPDCDLNEVMELVEKK